MKRTKGRKVYSKVLTRRLYIWNFSEPDRAWKYSFDSSDYVAWITNLWSVCAAFERYT